MTYVGWQAKFTKTLWRRDGTGRTLTAVAIYASLVATVRRKNFSKTIVTDRMTKIDRHK